MAWKPIQILSLWFISGSCFEFTCLRKSHPRRWSLRLSASIELDTLKAKIQKEIQPTKRGLINMEPIQKQKIDSLIQQLERRSPLKEPARSALMNGKWMVQYSTAPPPSNGQLGPFIGIARQYIDLKSKSYINHLSVPGELKDEWLSAILSATFEEWDGKTLGDFQQSSGSETVSSSTPDYGANCWKVTFNKLAIKVFGIFQFEKEFKSNTSRVWKMTYLDEDTRIVRAGKTGLDQDDVLFFMTRDI